MPVVIFSVFFIQRRTTPVLFPNVSLFSLAMLVALTPPAGIDNLGHSPAENVSINRILLEIIWILATTVLSGLAGSARMPP